MLGTSLSNELLSCDMDMEIADALNNPNSMLGTITPAVKPCYTPIYILGSILTYFNTIEVSNTALKKHGYFFYKILQTSTNQFFNLKKLYLQGLYFCWTQWNKMEH